MSMLISISDMSILFTYQCCVLFLIFVLSIYLCAMLLIVFADMRRGEASTPCSCGNEQEVLVEFPDLMILIGLGVFWGTPSIGKYCKMGDTIIVGDPSQLALYFGVTLHIQSQRCALLTTTMLVSLMYPVQTGKETT